MKSRLILHLGSQQYLLPDDVDVSTLVTVLRDTTEVSQQGYPVKYRIGKIARLQFEIVDERDIIVKEEEKAMPPSTNLIEENDDQPL